MKRRWVFLGIGLTFATAGCIAGAPEDDDVIESDSAGEDTDSEESGLIGTTGSLGYTCTTTIDGTTCTCTMGVPETDDKTCKGMDQVCHDHGATIVCTYPPGGQHTCACSYGKAKGSTGGLYFGTIGSKLSP